MVTVATKRTSFADLGGAIGKNSPIGGAKIRETNKPVTAGAEGVFLANVPVEKLAGNPRNPRDELKNLEDLSSIVDVQLQPGSAVTRETWLKVFPGDDTEIGEAEYIVVTGNRRLAAAREYGRPGLDVVVRDSLAASPASVLTSAMLENIAREDFDVIEEAKAVEMLVKELSTAAAAATMLKKSAAWVSTRRALLNLTPELQEKLRAGELGVREARALVKVPREEQVAAWLAELERKEAPPVPPEDPKPSPSDAEKNDDEDRPEVTPVDKIVKAFKNAKADPETATAALEEFFDPADLIQIKHLIKG